ncbi:MAG: hypothetical protein KF746_09530 [Chitinophagaceae bacterium]|nr:hypothetical protein [Chitinophagaceae bacterium]
MKTKRTIFEITAGDRPYTVNATSYLNGSEQLRFRVSVNNSPVFIFGWNEQLDRYAIMKDDRDPAISPSVEMQIAHMLEAISSQMKVAA